MGKTKIHDSHLWTENQWGQSCLRCGFFVHTEESVVRCSGRNDAQIIADSEAKIKALTERLEFFRRHCSVPAETLGQRVKGD
jgi:hypothetical protein